ncbi:GlcNAc-PI de-N-acetylase [Rubritalea squalenifaciens DSM 18772]|uniref:GlcNAc-PI de-N-acetylase n=1 Tax=Rubritalea squalenifaciens DSM 18772 TaxID=1123071 RepID=A0A1M6B3T6_9BACT|nr:GlcNAc-PI de-N-acetylase [Rubritalea squalenifaciens DSM 18772]
MLKRLLILIPLTSPAHAGLVSSFSFDEASDPGHDSGSAAQHGTLTGDAHISNDAAQGSGSLALDGTGDYLSLPATSGQAYTSGLTSDGDGFTVCHWIRLDSSASGLQRVISADMSSGFSATGWGTGIQSTSSLRATTYGIKDYDTSTNSTISANTWHHLAYVYKGNPINQVAMYVDGQLISQVNSSAAGLNASSGRFIIGGLALPSNPQFFHGKIDELRIYDHEMSTQEIEEVYSPSAPLTYEQWIENYELDLQTDGAANADADADGLLNSEEFQRGTNPTLKDSDQDGLEDGEEISAGTDPLDEDSDNDGFSDGEEVNQLQSDPLDPTDPNTDADGDGLPNTWETTHGLDATDNGSTDANSGAEGDPDQDGLPNREEYFLGSNPQVNEDGRAWLARPDKVRLMVFSCHPDDEGIFFGGVIPYYSQTLKVPTLCVSVTSGDHNRAPEVREKEFRDAVWAYGSRLQPIFPRFKDAPVSIDDTWDWWADGSLDGQGADTGRQIAATRLASYIRRYRPDVVAGHDFNGEYGHNNHKAAALATADAVLYAADESMEIDGLPAWQVKKFYVHRSSTRPFFHDGFKQTSIDTTGDGTPDSTPLQVANLGLDMHLSQGGGSSGFNVASVYAPAGSVKSSWAPHVCEEWGLYQTTVGDDPTVSTSFTEGTGSYTTSWARGHFFQNIPYFTDSDADQIADEWEIYHFGSLEQNADNDDDGDGYTLVQEFQKGLIPTQQDRIPLQLNGNSITFTVPSAANSGLTTTSRRYRLLQSSDLITWTEISSGIATGQPVTLPVTPSSGKAFYRIETTVD